MYNSIEEIPTDISKLKELTHLYLFNNKIKEIPIDSLQRMYSLKCIDLGNNFVDYIHISEVYKELEKNCDYSILKDKIKKLDENSEYFWFHGKITEIPLELFQFTNLIDLAINGKNLTEVPREIIKLKNLKSLSLSYNKLSSIPEEIFKMKSLKSISFDNNEFEEFSVKLLYIPNLTDISFNYNKIKFIKSSLDVVVKNDRYEYFSFGENPLKDFNAKTFQGGLDYIREYEYGISLEH